MPIELGEEEKAKMEKEQKEGEKMSSEEEEGEKQKEGEKMSSSSSSGVLHVMFLPFLAAGHMVPMLDMAKLFADRGATASVAVTPKTAGSVVGPSYPSLRPVLLPPFSSSTAGLPDGAESTSALPSALVTPAFIAACDEFSSPFRALLLLHRPHAVVADVHFPWAAHHAASLSLPLLSFHGTSHFSTAVASVLAHLKPHLDPALSDDDRAPFLLPWLPHPIRLTRAQIPPHVASPTDLVRRMSEAHPLAHGMLMNSFRALEEPYIRLMSRFLRSWTLGPVHHPMIPSPSPSPSDPPPPRPPVLSWLDAQPPGSAVYVCFGSMGRFTPAQLRAIAAGLEAAGRPFVWVVKEACAPEGYERRIGGRGKILSGWAPQREILRHPAVGGFVTHCGWNSVMEAVAAGKAMATWPLHAEQFFNEKLLVEVAGLGVRVGEEKERALSEEAEGRAVVAAEEVAAAVEALMGEGGAAEARRMRAAELGKEAEAAVAEGGSSYDDLTSLIDELIQIKEKKEKE